jgi:hypothetical protein
MRKLIGVLAVSFLAAAVLASPASAEPQGYFGSQEEIGFFYGTFDQSPNIALLVGGPAEEFCEGDPGTAFHRLFFRSDGSLDIKVNDKDQPIYLYNISSDFDGIPPWLDQVCQDGLTPEPFASGTADLKIRVSVLSPTLVDVSNSVNGKATGTDGTEYKVRGWADLIVENGIPVGDPADFVGFKLTEIGR